jgi:hypothetical protein
LPLESKNFVASPADIEAITRDVLHAASKGKSGRGSYFSALIATTQHELGISPRQRAGHPQRTTTEERLRQLAALEKVHLRFYDSVMRVAREQLPPGKNAGIELNRRTNFARSAMSTVRSWLKVGNDISILAAASTSKASLAVKAKQQRKPSAHILTKQTNRYAEKLAKTAAALAGADKSAAVLALDSVIERLKQIVGKSESRSTRRGDGHHLRA